MSRPVTVSEAQDQLLETALDLYRIMQRLHHQHEGLKAQYEAVREYYEAEEPSKDRPTIELAVAEETDIAVNELEDLAERPKASRLTDATIREKWRRDRKARTS